MSVEHRDQLDEHAIAHSDMAIDGVENEGDTNTEGRPNNISSMHNFVHFDTNTEKPNYLSLKRTPCL